MKKKKRRKIQIMDAFNTVVNSIFKTSTPGEVFMGNQPTENDLGKKINPDHTSLVSFTDLIIWT